MGEVIPRKPNNEWTLGDPILENGFKLSTHNAWLAQVGLEPVIVPGVNEPEVSKLSALGYEDLEKIRREAVTSGNTSRLQELRTIALSRDGLDDTDASYFYFAEQCLQDINELTQQTGE